MVYIGLMGAGLVPAPASPAATAKELCAMIELIEPYFMIVHSDQKTLVQEALKIAKHTPQAIVGMDDKSDYGVGNIHGLVQTVAEDAVLPFEDLHGRKSKDALALIPFSR